MTDTNPLIGKPVEFPVQDYGFCVVENDTETLLYISDRAVECATFRNGFGWNDCKVFDAESGWELSAPAMPPRDELSAKPKADRSKHSRNAMSEAEAEQLCSKLNGLAEGAGCEVEFGCLRGKKSSKINRFSIAFLAQCRDVSTAQTETEAAQEVVNQLWGWSNDLQELVARISIHYHGVRTPKEEE